MEVKGPKRGTDAKRSFSLESSPAHLLHRAQQRAADVTAQALRAHGLTTRQYAVLLVLSEANEMAQSTLVQATGIDRSTLADMLARMAKRGLVTSERTESDQRANLVRMTPQGSGALEAVAPKVADAEERMLESLPKNTRDIFVEALQLIANQGKR